MAARAGAICLFDVDGTLTAPRQASPGACAVPGTARPGRRAPALRRWALPERSVRAGSRGSGTESVSALNGRGLACGPLGVSQDV